MEMRLATPEDAPALLEIYGQYIDTTITFEYELPTVREFERRIREISAEYPYLVCTEGGRPVGYAYAHRQRERAAYQWNAELSIYLDAGHTTHGLGRRLYLALMALLRLQGVRTVYGCVTMPNERSEHLHTGLGFRKIGVFRETGYKCGAWHDVCWYEKEIAPYTPEPAPCVPIGAIPAEDVAHILADAVRREGN